MWTAEASDERSIVPCGQRSPDRALILDAGRRSPCPRVVGAVSGRLDEGPEINDFGRMAHLVKSNERLFAELNSNHSRMAEARSYLARPEANVALGQARLDRLRERHSAILARLRVNRAEGRRLLARYGAKPAEGSLIAC